MKLLFTTALFFAVMAKGSSLEEQPATGTDPQLTLEDIEASNAMLMEYYFSYDMEAIDKDFAKKKDAFKKKKNSNRKKHDFKFKDDKKDMKDDDDDDRRLFFDIDDDDNNRSEPSVIVPECVIGGINFLRCDPDTLAAQDERACELIDDLVCDRRSDRTSTVDEEIYCGCIGLDSNQDMILYFNNFLTANRQDDSGDKSADKGGEKDKDKDDKSDNDNKVAKDNVAESDAEKQKAFEEKKKAFKESHDNDVDQKTDKSKENKENKDLDEKKKELDRKKKEFEKKKKDFKDKKHDGDDDDDDIRRTIILPQCIVGGTNYQRCNPRSIRAQDERTCDDIDEFVCDRRGGNNRNLRTNIDEEEFCECIGLDSKENAAAGLRGIVSVY